MLAKRLNDRVFDAFAKQCTWLEQRAESAERARMREKRFAFLLSVLAKFLRAYGHGWRRIIYSPIGNWLKASLPLRELRDDYYQFDHTA